VVFIHINHALNIYLDNKEALRHFFKSMQIIKINILLMLFKIKLEQVKVIWTEIGLYLKTNVPVRYHAQRIPFDTKITMEGEFATIEISDEDYKKYNLHFFDYLNAGIVNTKKKHK
jgi:hypothetical protein